MELWTLELTVIGDGVYGVELRGIFTSYVKAQNAINVKGYWTTHVIEFGKVYEGLNLDPFFKDEFGGRWDIYKTVVDTLLPSDWSDYA